MYAHSESEKRQEERRTAGDMFNLWRSLGR
jgi:hypothetical protein